MAQPLPVVLIFGVFDMLHPGHEYFIKEAQRLGNLHICLASDGYVKEVKNKVPHHTWEERKEMLRTKFPNVIVHKGDDTMGTWSILKDIKPDIIAIGYDQHELYRALNKITNARLEFIKPYHKDIYKTSLLEK